MTALSFIFAIAGLGALTVLEPRINGSTRFISDYARTSHAWILDAVYGAAAVGLAGLAVLVGIQQAPSRERTLATMLFGASAAAVVTFGLWPWGDVHRLLVTIGIATLGSALFIILGLVGHSPRAIILRRGARIVFATTILVAVGLLLATNGILPYIGWIERIYMVATLGVLTIASLAHPSVSARPLARGEGRPA
ncbi:MAG: DUF998 domain-containing protein [Thermoplasmatota archaeon]